MSVVEKVKLICADIDNNANKYWEAELMDDGSIAAQWGRVGGGKQSTTYPASRGGKRFLDKKVREKEKKGYKRARTVDAAVSQGEKKTVNKGSLHAIAKNQIATSGNPLVDKLVGRLVKENIHNIEGHTSLKFDDASGLFQTPLGVVEPDALDEARDILAEIAPLVRDEKWSNRKLRTLCNDFLMIVPQDIGMKRFDPSDFFAGGQKSITEQLDILDALQSSYDALNKKSKKKSGNKSEAKVFDLHLDVVSPAELARIKKKFQKTRQDVHAASRGFKVVQAYEVRMNFSRDRFNPKGLANVWELWHGTKTANLLSILKSGLRVSPPSTAAIAGKAFSNGVYFSDQSTKSLNYAAGYWTGGSFSNCFMFLANVAMGNYYVPTTTRSSPPPRGYDSYFAKAGKPFLNNEMVVFDESHFDLVKLVEFEKK